MDTTIVLKDSYTGRMSDDEFLRFCLENKDLRIERNSNLEISIMPPVTTQFSFYNNAVSAQLFAWATKHKNGMPFESSAGFTLPDRSILSPDAAWVSKARWSKLSEKERHRFAQICPEFVIEVRSKSDDLVDLMEKMQIWIKNGASVAWLIDPLDKRSYIYRQSSEPRIIEGFDQKILGEGPVTGFELDLSLLNYTVD